MQISKKVIKDSGITVPHMLHRETGVLPGVPVGVIADAARIHVVKHIPACQFCGVVEDVAVVCEMEVCRTCAGKIAEVFQ